MAVAVGCIGYAASICTHQEIFNLPYAGVFLVSVLVVAVQTLRNHFKGKGGGSSQSISIDYSL